MEEVAKDAATGGRSVAVEVKLTAGQGFFWQCKLIKMAGISDQDVDVVVEKFQTKVQIVEKPELGE